MSEESVAARGNGVRPGNAIFHGVEAGQLEIPIVQNSTKIEGGRGSEIDPDDASGIRILEQIMGGSVENDPYVAVVQHRYDFGTILEAPIIPVSRVVTLPKISECKSMVVG
jgi:hypothetical protein